MEGKARASVLRISPCKSLERFLNFGANAIKISVHLIIGKAQNGKAVFFQYPRSVAVPPFSLCAVMLLAVKLDREPRRMAVKIDDVSVNGNLPLKSYRIP